jgi:NAD(P)-dependent dehydrogenase (short-subunit alcohol dehydrogenase family)
VGLVLAAARSAAASPDLAALAEAHGARLARLALDVTDEASVSAAAAAVAELTPRLHLVLNAAGVLHDDAARVRPEKRLEDVSPAALQSAFAVNAIGPLLVAKHLLPRLRHGERAVLASVSARVGSIGDNRLGGWYAYRASKAAQNQATRTLAVELRRRAPNVIVVALHPGTVDTDLSRPFQRGVDPAKLLSPARAAERLLAVIDSLSLEESGTFWDGERKPVPW